MRRAFCKAKRWPQRIDLWRVSSALSFRGDVPYTDQFDGIRRKPIPGKRSTTAGRRIHFGRVFICRANERSVHRVSADFRRRTTSSPVSRRCRFPPASPRQVMNQKTPVHHRRPKHLNKRSPLSSQFFANKQLLGSAPRASVFDLPRGKFESRPTGTVSGSTAVPTRQSHHNFSGSSYLPQSRHLKGTWINTSYPYLQSTAIADGRSLLPTDAFDLLVKLAEHCEPTGRNKSTRRTPGMERV